MIPLCILLNKEHDKTVENKYDIIMIDTLNYIIADLWKPANRFGRHSIVLGGANETCERTAKICSLQKDNHFAEQQICQQVQC